MHVLDLTLTTLDETLALDEALLLEAEAGRGGELLRFWEWPRFAAVLGAGCKIAEDINLAACQVDKVAIGRRSSGGGTVLLGKGCMNFSLVLSYERAPELREIKSSYCYIFHLLCAAFGGLGLEVSCAGTSDLVVSTRSSPSLARKFSGNAQQRKRRFLLHHGTMLYDFPLDAIERYLHLPGRQPDYRGRREHRDFLVNLNTSAADLKRVLCAAWNADEAIATWPQEAVAQLVAEKYNQREWTHRR